MLQPRWDDGHVVGVEPTSARKNQPKKPKKEAAAKSVSAARRTNTEKFSCSHVNGVGVSRLAIQSVMFKLKTYFDRFM